MIRTYFLVLFLILNISAFSQLIPGEDESIPFFVTIGGDSQENHSDDAKVQDIFILIPFEEKDSVFIRIFDADIGSSNDIKVNDFNSQANYKIFGGPNAYWDGNISSKIIDAENFPIYEKDYDSSGNFDNKWTTFCKINPEDGASWTDAQGYVFKFSASGLNGDDFNCFKIFISSSSKENVAIEGVNSFRYVSTCLFSYTPEVGHSYPFIMKSYNYIELQTKGVNLKDSLIVSSIEKEGTKLTLDPQTGKSDKLTIEEREINLSLDIQFYIDTKSEKKNQVMTYSMIGDNSIYIPNFSIPIGGVPIYKSLVKAKPIIIE